MASSSLNQFSGSDCFNAHSIISLLSSITVPFGKSKTGTVPFGEQSNISAGLSENLISRSSTSVALAFIAIRARIA